jgi:hypothetical protein
MGAVHATKAHAHAHTRTRADKFELLLKDITEQIHVRMYKHVHIYMRSSACDGRLAYLYFMSIHTYAHMHPHMSLGLQSKRWICTYTRTRTHTHTHSDQNEQAFKKRSPSKKKCTYVCKHVCM